MSSKIMSDKFSKGRGAANSTDAAAAFRDQLFARALAQQLLGSSGPSTSAAPQMEQSRMDLMEQLHIMVRLSGLYLTMISN